MYHARSFFKSGEEIPFSLFMCLSFIFSMWPKALGSIHFIAWKQCGGMDFSDFLPAVPHSSKTIQREVWPRFRSAKDRQRYVYVASAFLPLLSQCQFFHRSGTLGNCILLMQGQIQQLLSSVVCGYYQLNVSQICEVNTARAKLALASTQPQCGWYYWLGSASM